MGSHRRRPVTRRGPSPPRGDERGDGPRLANAHRATGVARLRSGYGGRVSGLCRRSEWRGSAVCLGEGAVAVEEMAVPATGSQHDASRLVFEKPSSEVLPGPPGHPRDPDRRPRAIRPLEDLAERHRHVVIRGEAAQHGLAVARGDLLGVRESVVEDRVGRESAGEQRLADALARQAVGRARRVADEQRPRPR